MSKSLQSGSRSTTSTEAGHPRGARLLPVIGPVVLAGVAALAAAAVGLLDGGTDATLGGAALAFALAAVAAERFPVPVMGVSAGGVSLAAVFIVGAAVVVGWETAVLVGFLARGSIELWQRRPVSRFSYNSCTYALAALAAGGASSALHSRRGDGWLAVEIAVSATGFWVVNLLLIALIVARASATPMHAVARRSTEGTIIPFGIMASLTVILAVLWQRGPFLSLALLGPILTVALYQRSTHGKLEALQLAKTDPLTGLGNHRSFHERLVDLVAQCADVGGRFSVCLVDVDDFKQVNDRHGHAHGDALLSIVAESLDTHGEAFRLGGDEFAMLIPGATAPVAERHARDAMTSLSGASTDGSATISISVGIAVFPENGESTSILLEHADQALYRSKYAGKGRVQTFDADLVPLDLGRRRLADRRGQVGLLRALADATSTVQAHPETSRISDLAGQIALTLGLSPDDSEVVRLAHDLRDLGAFAIPAEILEKPAVLSEAEWTEVQRHPGVSARMLDALGLHEVAQIVRHHHERFDGTGYPSGLAGGTIPLAARIVCVTDALEAMTTQRTYREPFDTSHALAEIRRCAGTQFDPAVVAALMQLVEPGAEPVNLAIAG